MLISIVIPTRHRNEQLAQCLDQLAPGKQTIDASSYEVIVTDDGVETSAEAMIRERYPWAKWVPGPRHGPGANRNHGVKYARGEWLAFTDDDCIPNPDWLAAFVARLEGVEVLEGQTVCRRGLNSPLLEAPVNVTGGNFWSCNLLIRRDEFERIGGFDPEFLTPGCEDLEFATRIRRSGARVRFVADAEVDHPPRLRPRGWRAGLRWANRVLVHYKEGNPGPVWTWLPFHVVKHRLAQIGNFPPRLSSLRAIFSLVGEFSCVLVHLPSWERRYRRVQPIRIAPACLDSH